MPETSLKVSVGLSGACTSCGEVCFAQQMSTGFISGARFPYTSAPEPAERFQEHLDAGDK